MARSLSGRRRERFDVVDARPFPELGLTVWVLRDRKPPPHAGPAGR